MLRWKKLTKKGEMRPPSISSRDYDDHCSVIGSMRISVVSIDGSLSQSFKLINNDTISNLSVSSEESLHDGTIISRKRPMDVLVDTNGSLKPPSTIVVSRKLYNDSISLTSKNNNNADVSSPPSKKRKMVTALISPTKTNNPNKNFFPPPPMALIKGTRLLFLPEDVFHLNPLHCFVRQNVEVFSATEADIAIPSPGRKNRVVPEQIGIRCVHCRFEPFKNRVKRAVCYPSSVSRVYHSVSDMKFDHFGACKNMPLELKDKFQSLKLECCKKGGKALGRNSSSTAKYYFNAAKKIGMVDTDTGIFFNRGLCRQVSEEVDFKPIIPVSETLPSPPSLAPHTVYTKRIPKKLRNASKNGTEVSDPIWKPSQPPMKLDKGINTTASVHTPNLQAQSQFPSLPSLQTVGTTRCLLAMPKDNANLNSLHCFVRQNIEVFVASCNDIIAPSPGRKNRLVEGQVGLRCVHCSSVPPKDRVKRAVCYPPSINSIYHSVSNMKFDHFGNCKMMPKESRKQLDELRQHCGRRNGRLSGGCSGAGSSTTAQYYLNSATEMGLVDSDDGIRFRDRHASSLLPSRPSKTTASKEIPPKICKEIGNKKGSDNTGLELLVMAATDPERLNRAKSCIASSNKGINQRMPLHHFNFNNNGCPLNHQLYQLSPAPPYTILSSSSVKSTLLSNSCGNSLTRRSC